MHDVHGQACGASNAPGMDCKVTLVAIEQAVVPALVDQLPRIRVCVTVEIECGLISPVGASFQGEGVQHFVGASQVCREFAGGTGGKAGIKKRSHG